MKKKASVVLLLMGLFICITGCSKNLIKLKGQNFYAELGKSLDEQKSTYLNMPAEKLSDIDIDLSNVDVSKLGKYPASVTYKKEKADFTVTVRDTIAPDAKVKKNIHKYVNEAVYVSDIISDIDEVSGEVSVDFTSSGNVKQGLLQSLLSDNKDKDEDSSKVEETTVGNDFSLESITGVTYENKVITYAKEGKYKDTITLTDDSGNRADITYIITIEEGMDVDADEMVSEDTNIDYKSKIKAYDEDGSRIPANRIVVDSSNVKDAPGKYDVKYSILDEDGKIVHNFVFQVIIVENLNLYLEDGEIKAEIDGEVETINGIDEGLDEIASRMNEKINENQENIEKESEQIKDTTEEIKDKTEEASQFNSIIDSQEKESIKEDIKSKLKNKISN